MGVSYEIRPRRGGGCSVGLYELEDAKKLIEAIQSGEFDLVKLAQTEEIIEIIPMPPRIDEPLLLGSSAPITMPWSSR